MAVANTPGAEVANELVTLPPLVVEGAIPEPPWQYGRSARYEVLSCCPDATTRDLVATMSRASDILEVLLPRRFLPPPTPRDALILLDETYWPARSQESVAALLRAPRPLAGLDAASGSGGESAARDNSDPAHRQTVDPLARGGSLVWNQPALRRPPKFFRNLRLGDPDGMTTFVLVSRDNLDLDGWRPSTGSLRELLERRTPQLPPWFVTGFLAVYGQLRFVDDSWTLPPFAGLPAPVMPLADFLTPPADSDTAALRLAQAELLVRWASDPDNAAIRNSFWRLLDAACIAPVTESTFNDCFGFGFEEGAQRLQEYVPVATRRTQRWHYNAPENSSANDAFPLHEATPVEIARIKGAWERQETTNVRGRLPGLTEQYERQARRTLERGLQSAPHDPAVLAELGVLEDDAGQRSRARELLEEATAAGPVRPLALVRLARLRYEEVRATTTSPPNALTEEELQPVFRSLEEAGQKTPPILETYRLLTEVRRRAAMPPPAVELEQLYTGAMLFAQDVDVVDAVVSMLVKASLLDRARRLTALSLSQIEAPAARQRLEAWLTRAPPP